MQAKKTTKGIKKEIKRKSVPLEPFEKQLLKKCIKQHNTLTEAAETIGVSRQVLDRITLVGSGNPANIEIIRNYLKSLAA